MKKYDIFPVLPDGKGPGALSKLPLKPDTSVRVENLPLYSGDSQKAVTDFSGVQTSGVSAGSGTSGRLNSPSAGAASGSEDEGTALFDMQLDLEKREKWIRAMDAYYKSTNDDRILPDYAGEVNRYRTDMSDYDERCKKYRENLKAESNAATERERAANGAYANLIGTPRENGIENRQTVGYNGSTSLTGALSGAQAQEPGAGSSNGNTSGMRAGSFTRPPYIFGGDRSTGIERGPYTGGTPLLQQLAYTSGGSKNTSSQGFSDVAVRSANESQGNTVHWNPGTEKGRSIITLTNDKTNAEKTLREGTDYYIGSDGKAYYINSPVSAVKVNGKKVRFDTSRHCDTIRVNGSVLHRGTDYYVGSDGYAYYYGNVRSKNESRGYGVIYFPGVGAGNSQIVVSHPDEDTESYLKEGKDYYIGSDGKAHYFVGPPSQGTTAAKLTEVSNDASDGSGGASGPFSVDPGALVAMAESQVGYTEKNSKDYEDDDPVDASHKGSENYTKYGAYTANDGYAWCASFVSWCIYGVNQESAFEKSASTGYIMNEYNTEGSYRDNDHQTPPCAGDIVIFCAPGKAVTDKNGELVYNSDGTLKLGVYHCHIGIVVGYDPATRTVYTVEGNTSGVADCDGCVNYHHYSLDDTYNGGRDKNYYMQGFCANGGTSYGTITDEMKKSEPTTSIY